MNSLRGAINKEYYSTKPNELFNLPDRNYMASVFKHRLEKIVHEDMPHTAGATRQIPHYHQIMGGCTQGLCPRMYGGADDSESEMSSESEYSPTGDIDQDIEEFEQKHMGGPSGMIHRMRGEMKEQKSKKQRAKEQAELKRLVKQAEKQQKGAMSRAQIRALVKDMRDREKINRLNNAYIQDLDLHHDEVARTAHNMINQARMQMDYNSPGGRESAYFFVKPHMADLSAYQGSDSELQNALNRMLRHNLDRQAMMREYGPRGGAWYDVFTKAFKKAGEILTETPLKYIPGISTVGDIYKGIGSLGSGGSRRIRQSKKSLRGGERDDRPFAV